VGKFKLSAKNCTEESSGLDFLTKFMEQCPWKANSRPGGKEIMHKFMTCTDEITDNRLCLRDVMALLDVISINVVISTYGKLCA
jgi:hypothetical protein